jgi:hypothetical protein
MISSSSIRLLKKRLSDAFSNFGFFNLQSKI